MRGTRKEQKMSRRNQLRNDFLEKKHYAQQEDALLEILLSYAIPRIDLQPLVRDLMSRYGNLSGILEADFNDLITISGIKEYTATLIKIVEYIKSSNILESNSVAFVNDSAYQKSLTTYTKSDDGVSRSQPKPSLISRKGSRTGMVSKALMKEAVELLPNLPDTSDIDVVREYIRNNLRFNAESSRQRYAAYILTYIFPDNIADHAIRLFASKYPDSQALRDVCFYRFCKTYPLTYEICDHLLLRNIGKGSIDRLHIKDFLTERFPNSKYVKDGIRGFREALTGAGIVQAENNTMRFKYRHIPLASFAFILHSEYPKPRMYDIENLERNPAIRSLLWNPEEILVALYELRNLGIIAKVSEIDTVRQFTTKYTLEEAVKHLVNK
jgi:DNA repair protein RadC